MRKNFQRFCATLIVEKLIKKEFTGLEITAGHHCGGETFQNIFSLFG